jgi:multiple sugar transport system permease protein
MLRTGFSFGLRRYPISFEIGGHDVLVSKSQPSAQSAVHGLFDRHTLQRLSRAVPAIVFLAPATISFILFRYYPLLRGIYMSFFRWDSATPPGEFISLANYSNALTSEHFYLLLKNTLILFAFGVLCGFWVPVAQALVLHQLRGGYQTFRFLYVLPVAVPSMAFLMTWMFIWYPDSGVANALMRILGLPEQAWIADPQLVKLCLRIPGLMGGGVGILIYTAAIQNISEEVVEAAIVDGATAIQRTLRIILPNILPIINIMFVISLTQSLLAFEDVWIMTQGGPGYASSTLVIGVYQRAFVQHQYGVASAWAVLILILTLAFTWIRLKTMNDERY